jgi:Na+/H+ antiporter NhaD/arsenite permease-like protein
VLILSIILFILCVENINSNLQKNGSKNEIEAVRNYEKSLICNYFLFSLLTIFIIVEDIFEIPNGIIGVKRDAFLKLIRYIEYSNKKKLQAV